MNPDTEVRALFGPEPYPCPNLTPTPGAAHPGDQTLSAEHAPSDVMQALGTTLHIARRVPSLTPEDCGQALDLLTQIQHELLRAFGVREVALF